MYRPRRGTHSSRRYRPGDPVFDRYDNEIKVDDFISYVLFHEGAGSGANIFYGYVTKIGKTGKIDARSIKLHPDDAVVEKTIKDNACIIKMPTSVEKAWKDHLMMAKLAAA